MKMNPEWYLVEITPAERDNRLTDRTLRFETPAGDRAGAEWLARITLEDLARSKDIKPSQLTSTVTPCKDC